jgi:hypothetical protein
VFYVREKFTFGSRWSLKAALVAQLCVISVWVHPNVATADSTMTKPNLWSGGVTAGTQGIGGEFSYLLYNNFVVRANGSHLSIDWNSKGDDEKLNVSGSFAGATIDFHPFQTGWRVSAGVKYVDIEYNSSVSNRVTIGSMEYTSEQIGELKTLIRSHNPAAPYLGFGYDASHYSREGAEFNLGLDIGALYTGEPDVTLGTTRNNNAPELASHLAAETAKLKDDIRKNYLFYPVVMISGRISF